MSLLKLFRVLLIGSIFFWLDRRFLRLFNLFLLLVAHPISTVASYNIFQKLDWMIDLWGLMIISNAKPRS